MNTMTTNSKMAASVDYAAMSIQDLLNNQETINSILENRKKEALNSIKALGIPMEEIASFLGVEMTTSADVKTEETVKSSETTPSVPQNNAPIIPEVKDETPVETKESVFNDPIFKEPFNPLATKNVTSTTTEGELMSMEELLSTSPMYKEYYCGKPSVPEDKRKLVPMDELLSEEPINKLFNMGNEKDKDADYRQHTRFAHAFGLIPTEMATGKTGIYIPKL